MTKSTQSTLLLGAGELGSAILTPLSAYPNIKITVAVRDPSRYASLESEKTSFIALGLTDLTIQELATAFAPFDIIISCSGFGMPTGSQMKIAEAALAAGKQRVADGKQAISFFPWQWGVDYDITGDANGTMELFGEQLNIRNLLRAQSAYSGMNWTIVSTGIFMSFLFEPYWGFVEPEGEDVVVRALGSWENRVTVSTVEDIGSIAARIVCASESELETKDKIVYMAGETISYARLAKVVEIVFGKKVRRELWSVDHLREELKKDPENLVKKYRVVFAEGNGVSWDEKGTVNRTLGMQVTDVETWARENLKV